MHHPGVAQLIVLALVLGSTPLCSSIFVAAPISLGTYPSALVAGQTHGLVVGIGDDVVEDPYNFCNEYRERG